MFDDDCELDDEEDSETDGEEEIYGYLGDPILRRADLMAAALGEVEDDIERGELMAASLGINDNDEEREPGEDDNTEPSISGEGSSIGTRDNGISARYSNTASDRDVLAPYLVRTK